MNITVRKFLEEVTLKREIVGRFLDSGAYNGFAFDDELGYKLRDSCPKDGVDSSFTVARFQPGGEQLMLNFADRPCRINTYGNSFTQCSQASDGETWQEYLAAHFGEPIRNFGVGGFGVYQTYRRMLREEKTNSSAEYIILNIWSDDHFRSLFKWPWLRYTDEKRNQQRKHLSRTELYQFHYVTWAHIRLNPDTAQFEECDNPCSTPESLYLLCGRNRVYETFKDDFEVQAYLAQKGATDIKTGILQKMADVLYQF